MTIIVTTDLSTVHVGRGGLAVIFSSSWKVVVYWRYILPFLVVPSGEVCFYVPLVQSFTAAETSVLSIPSPGMVCWTVSLCVPLTFQVVLQSKWKHFVWLLFYDKNSFQLKFSMHWMYFKDFHTYCVIVLGNGKCSKKQCCVLASRFHFYFMQHRLYQPIIYASLSSHHSGSLWQNPSFHELQLSCHTNC